MTDSLVMLFDAPLQSWGVSTQSMYRRDTALMPSMSGVCGMLANALGWKRDHDISILTDASLTAREDRAGQILRDYQTIGSPGRGPWKAEGGNRPGSVPVDRYYLNDAAFAVIYTPAEPDLAAELCDAVERPARPLYFGRMNCVPSFPVVLGVSSADPMSIVEHMPVFRGSDPASNGFGSDAASDGTIVVRVETDAVDGQLDNVITRTDKPLSFKSAERLYFEQRPVRQCSITIRRENCVERTPEGWDRMREYVKGTA